MFRSAPLSRLPKIAAALSAGLAFTLAAPVLAPAGFGFAATTAQAQEPSQFKSVLSAYGEFQAHEKYGEVWVPARSTVPEGWHPYPSCQWVYTKDLGWYFDDKTAWGKIVHHYGRWAHDKDLGWVWVKGDEFSPGWVVWRTSDKWVGWAPMPPEQDVKTISATEFNSDKHWTFMDAKIFGKGCDGGTTVVSTPPATIYQETKLVTEIKFVSGIAVFVLPPPLIINIVDLDIGIIHPWSPCFFGAWFWQWNMFANNVIININVNGPQCQVVPLPMKKAPTIIPIISKPPPPPGGAPGGSPGGSSSGTPKWPEPIRPDRRVEVPKPIDPGYVRPKPIDPGIVRPRPDGPKIPPVVIRPDFPKIPPIVKPDRPHRPDQPTIPPVVKRPVPKLPPIADKPRGNSGGNASGIFKPEPRLGNIKVGAVNRVPSGRNPPPIR